MRNTNTLKNENSITRKGYIEREAAKRAIMWCEDENNFDFSQGLIAAEDTLDNIPAADVVPVVHGAWVDEGRMCHCSVCGRRKYFKENYCPDCGAKMDKDGHGE